jgi:exopolysaccharide biosynthesis operon protein EpsL
MPSQKYLIYVAKKFLVASSCCLLAVQLALADQFDTLNYTVSGGISYDDNVFRLPSDFDSQIYLGKDNKSDLTRFVSIGLNIDKKHSNQEVVFSANATKIKYNNFSNLDYTSSTIKGEWSGQISSKFKGGLKAARAQTLSNPADTRIYTRNLSTIDSFSMNGDWGGGSKWHWLFGISSGHSTNSINTTNNQGSRNNSSELGVKYYETQSRTLALISRSVRRANANQIANSATLIDTGSTEKQLELQAGWDITGKSVLTVNLMDLQHRGRNFHQRNYSATQGGIHYVLKASGKTSLALNWQRNFSIWWDSASSYYVADRFSISPTWQITPQIVMRASFNRGINDYRGAVVPGAIARKDATHSESIGVDWFPTKIVAVSTSILHEKRISTPANYSSFGFDNNTVSISAQANF